MEVRLRAAGETRTVAVTMRTPGNDFELAAGFLYGEGVISGRDQIVTIDYCMDPDLGEDQRYNVVTVEMSAGDLPDLRHLERNFYTTSACGVCGKASLDALEIRGVEPVPPGPHIHSAIVTSLGDKLRAAQGIFDSTGGLHAAALFDGGGDLLAAREDVGRHNAVDKLVGWSLLNGRLPLLERILMVSGRAGFEIMQKAIVARVPVVCAVSAPSSLAVDVARRFGVTLVGFARGRRFNIYSAPERIDL